jgi:hypothetical protein
MEALLVGSMNFASTEEAIDAVAEHAVDVLRRVPDGETGPRQDWFHWQVHVLARQPQLQGLAQATYASARGEDEVVFSRFRIRDGVTSEELELGPLGYAEAAIASYQIVRDRKEAGKIPQDVRFQVSLPTPVAVTSGFLDPGHQEPFEEAYERHLTGEMRAICDVIPPQELAVQWDVAMEMGMLEGLFPTWVRGELLTGLTDRLVRLGDLVPESAELGYHLCYGNRGNKHWKEPADAGKLADVANRVDAGTRRKIDWIHLPVPIERDDADYFAPLGNLSLQPGTQLYLGLLHKEDGVVGARRRYETARSVVPRFGIATECGMARESAQSMAGLLDLHADACRELAV